MNPTPVNLPSDVVEAIAKLKFTEILELERIGIEKAPTLNFGDSFVVATENDLTLRVTVDQLMQYLNENLRNFIMWKPVVTNKSLVWERSNDDTQPMPLDWADILFPIVSETENGMMTTDLYKKLRAIDAENIVYKSALDTAIATRAPKEHTHEQYLLTSNLPKNVSAFDNDAKYITLEEVPKALSHYTNDVKYVRYEDIPVVTYEKSGLATPDLLQEIDFIKNSLPNVTDIETIINNINNTMSSFTLSSFENDVPYVSADTLAYYFGELGGINLVYNSDFRYMTYPGRVARNWFCESGNVISCDGDYIGDVYTDSYGSIYIANGCSLQGSLLSSINYHATISFMAKAIPSDSVPGPMMMRLHICANDIEFELKDSIWTKYSFTIENDFRVTNDIIQFTNISGFDFTVNITHVKVENGRFESAYSPSYYDIINAYKHPATMDELGSIRPDGTTLQVDESGILSVIARTETSAAFIDDTTPSSLTVYSSQFTENMLKKGYAQIDANGSILTKHLPSFVDDIVEGEMTIDSEGNFVFVSDTAIFSEPSRGKIYLDTTTNASYRWSGSEYIRCSTDMLGGEVLVKYDKTDKYMYFVFPEE